MIVNLKEEHAQLDIDGRAVMELELDDGDFEDMEAELEDEIDYD